MRVAFIYICILIFMYIHRVRRNGRALVLDQTIIATNNNVKTLPQSAKAKASRLEWDPDGASLFFFYVIYKSYRFFPADSRKSSLVTCIFKIYIVIHVYYIRLRARVRS